MSICYQTAIIRLMDKKNIPFNYFFVQEQTGKHSDQVKAGIWRKKLDKNLHGDVAYEKERLKQLGSLGREDQLQFAPELLAFQDKLKEAFEMHFRKLGINHIHWPENVVRSPSFFSGNYQNVGLVHIRAAYSESEDDTSKELAKYQEAEALTHEIYHSVAPTKFRIGVRKNRRLLPIIQERQGFAYAPLHQNSRPAIEEGMAVKAVVTFRSVIDQSLPNGAYLRSLLLKQAAQTLPVESVKEIPPELLILEMNKGEVSLSSWKYINSYKLVNFLLDNVPHFEQLAEEMRQKDKVLQFAKAVTKVFGKGTYRLLIEATEDTATDVLKELGARLQNDKLQLESVAIK